MSAEGSIDKLIAWLVESGLNGATEDELVTGFCERAPMQACRSPVRW